MLGRRALPASSLYLRKRKEWGYNMSSRKRRKLGEEYLLPTDDYPKFPAPDRGRWKDQFFMVTEAIA